MPNSLVRSLGAPATAAGLMLAGSHAVAATYTLEPSGTLTNQAYVESYFNGGYDSYGTNVGGSNPAGPSDNVVFGPLQSPTLQTDFLINPTEVQYANIPSVIAGDNPKEAVFFQSVQSVMNLTNGYALSSLSFDYSIYKNSSTYTPIVTVWSGLNGTGSALETFNLAAPSGSSACTSTYDFCTWTKDTSNFTGLAESVTFGNSSGQYIGEAAFDSITVTETPVALPAALPLLLSGLSGLAGLARRRIRAPD